MRLCRTSDLFPLLTPSHVPVLHLAQMKIKTFVSKDKNTFIGNCPDRSASLRERTLFRQVLECVRCRAAFLTTDSTRRPDKWETENACIKNRNSSVYNGGHLVNGIVVGSGFPEKPRLTVNLWDWTRFRTRIACWIRPNTAMPSAADRSMHPAREPRNLPDNIVVCRD